MEQAEYSEKSAYNIQTPGNYPEESIRQKWYIYNATPNSISISVILNLKTGLHDGTLKQQ
jgi:hypothetical protein